MYATNGPRKNERVHELLIFEYPTFADEHGDLFGQKRQAMIGHLIMTKTKDM